MSSDRRWKALYCSLGASLLLAGSAGESAAQTEADGEALLEEIIVTAQRREQSLQSVPVAVTAISNSALRDNAVVDLGDIQSLAPNLTLHEGDARNAVVYIRGIGQVDSLAFADPGVGIYVDDVYLGRAQGAFLDVFDAERIEVLRGPQGTLYGRNTVGGAVKFVSRKPTNEVRATAGATLGGYDRIDLKGSLSGPLVKDRLFGKIAAAVISRDGYATNSVDGEDDGDKEAFAWRASLLFTPNTDWKIEISTDGSRDHADTSRTPARETSVFGIVPPNDDPFEIDADFNDLSDIDVWGMAGSISYSPQEGVTLRSISSYREMKYNTHLDLDATAFPFLGVFVFQDQNQFSQELQLLYDTGGRFDLVAGLYFFREHDITEAGVFGPAIAFVSNSLNDQINLSYAAYGQAGYALTDRLSLIAGLRFTYEKKSFDRIQEFFAADTPLVPPLGEGFRLTDIDVEDNWSNLSPKFGLEYTTDSGALIYATASRGFKSGGFDGRSNLLDDAVPYEPETVWSYELGAKATLLGGKATLNAAAFFYDYTNLQLSSFIADEFGDFQALFTNAGSAEMKGFEIEFAARPSADLTISASAGFLDGEYKLFIGPGGNDISGQRELVNAPKWTLRFAADYRLFSSDVGELTLRGDASYRSKVYPTVSSSSLLMQPGYTILNASLGFDSANGRWHLAVGGKNLTDERYRQHAFDLSDSLGYQLAYYGAPRTWYVSASLEY